MFLPKELLEIKNMLAIEKVKWKIGRKHKEVSKKEEQKGKNTKD